MDIGSRRGDNITLSTLRGHFGLEGLHITSLATIRADIAYSRGYVYIEERTTLYSAVAIRLYLN